MIIYNQAFDLYHTIYRILLLLNKIEENSSIEVERVRIWDFFLLFPYKISDIRLTREDNDLRELKKRFFKKSKNPYDILLEERKIFEKLKPYQLSAINCIASYGIIDKLTLLENRIVILNKSILIDFISKFPDIPVKEKNAIAFLTSPHLHFSLYGTNGLKNRTNLMESKYDA